MQSALTTAAPSLLCRPAAGAGLPTRRHHAGPALLQGVRRRHARVRSTPALTLAAFGAKKASGQAYICQDCGYIYEDRQPFEDLPKSYVCPVCQAPKRRFKVYQQAVPKNANALKTRKARKEELAGGGAGGDETLTQTFTVVGLGAVVGLVGLYLFLNSQY